MDNKRTTQKKSVKKMTGSRLNVTKGKGSNPPRKKTPLSTTSAVLATAADVDTGDGTDDLLIVAGSAHITSTVGAEYTNFDSLQVQNVVSVDLGNDSPEPVAAEAIASSTPKPLILSGFRLNSHSLQLPKKSKKIVVVKGELELSQVVTCLENILAGIKAETLCIQQGEEFVTLKPHSTVEVEIEATVKKRKERFVLELTWESQRDCEGTGFCIFSS